MSIQLLIAEARAEAMAVMARAEAQLREIQAACDHPNVNKVHKSNTGNYDPHADCYWTEFVCPDCGKFWHEDGSK